jgi:hypothetical protein
MIEKEFENLLNKQWLDEERELIRNIKEGIIYYRKLIPKALKSDVIAALQMCS